MKNKRPYAQQNAQPGHMNSQPDAPRRFAALSIILTLVLPILFLLTLFLANQPLRIIFLALTLLSVAAMWLFRAFVRSARSTLTIVYIALAIVIGVALLLDQETVDRKTTSSAMQEQGSYFNDTAALADLLERNITPAPTSAISSEIISEAQRKLELFMSYWIQGNVKQMLNLCTPSWIAQYQNPEQELFQLTSSSRPQDYIIESLSGSDGDSSRTITLKVMLQNISGQEAAMNRMHVLLFKVNNTWYVDPQSLGGTPIDEASELAAQNKTFVGSTIAPTATPAPSTGEGAVMLYYNSDGGQYYHAIPNCSAVNERYWPLAKFYYSDLNSQKFKNLIRCTKCDAPERPKLQ